MDRKSKRIIWGIVGCAVICMSLVWALPGKLKADEPLVKLYQLEYEEPNGQNGFYRTKPMVTITNKDSEAVTKYEFTTVSGEKKSGILPEEGSAITIKQEEFGEGVQSLEVWMEQPITIEPEPEPEPEPESTPILESPETKETLDDNQDNDQDNDKPQEPQVIWMEVGDSRKTVSFQVDTVTPYISLSAPNGFDAWYTNDVIVNAETADSGTSSGLGHIQYYINDTPINAYDITADPITTSYNLEIPVTESSINGNGITVTAEVTDGAGNVNRIERQLYIDRTPPAARIEGATDYLITGKPMDLSAVVAEENIVSSAVAHVKYTDVKGQTSETAVSDWASTDGSQKATLHIEKDGTYELSVEANDAAGHQSAQTIHITLDSENPMVRYVEQLNGRYFQYFQWNYKAEDMISDFTTYEYHMNVDGILYQSAERIMGEGLHRFEVDVTDAAGNQTNAQASFVVDHTPPEILFREAKEGEAYEENANLAITLSNLEDTIESIAINGRKQAISSDSQIFQFPFEETGMYEVQVIAEDLAGNVSKKEIHFQVVEKETVVAKMTEPVRKVIEKLGIGEKENETAAYGNTRASKNTAVYVVLAIAAVCGAGGFIWFLLGYVTEGKFEHKKRPHKREDAK